MKNKVAYSPIYGPFGLTEAGVKLGRELSGNPKWGGVRLPNEGGCQPIFGNYDVGVSRHDPVLIKVIEQLGLVAGSNAAIEVIEGNRYWIEENDGCETVHTPDSIEWVVIEA